LVLGSGKKQLMVHSKRVHSKNIRAKRFARLWGAGTQNPMPSRKHEKTCLSQRRRETQRIISHRPATGTAGKPTRARPKPQREKSTASSPIPLLISLCLERPKGSGRETMVFDLDLGRNVVICVIRVNPCPNLVVLS
jgi:hypothetical protein